MVKMGEYLKAPFSLKSLYKVIQVIVESWLPESELQTHFLQEKKKKEVWDR